MLGVEINDLSGDLFRSKVMILRKNENYFLKKRRFHCDFTLLPTVEAR